ncbi:MAG: twin-arginine translocase TatA/TatE family subunit [Bacteriovoracaceae bacterium]|nr:twin-arginine translocase TatA/TatE family subunit [Bacteriovoracaceae bacterium]
MFGLGFGEVIIILFIALLFIGPKKLPELAKSLGKSLKEFQKATRDFTEQMNAESNQDETKSIAQKPTDSDENSKNV